MATYVVTTLRDELNGGNRGEGLSLREAIAVANARDGADRIVFDPALDGGTIQLTRGELKILDTLTIDADATPDDDARDSVIGINAGGRSRIFNIDADRVSLDSLSLIKGSAKDALGGGAILHTNGSLFIDDVTFRQNFADVNDGSGGAIRSTASPTQGPNLAITGSEFFANRAVSQGAAISVENGGTTRLDGVTFRQNTVFAEDSTGGALYNTGRMVVESTSFTGNRSTAEGGAIWNGKDARLVLRDAAFTNNEAGTGGAIRNDGGGIDAARTNFVGNNANDREEGSGGAIASDRGAVFLNDSLFTRNEAGKGGAVEVMNGRLFATKATLTNNSAQGGDAEGGAIFAAGRLTSVRLVDVTVSDNRAGANGGGIAVEGSARLRIDDGLVSENTAQSGDGAGLYLRAARASLTDVKFAANVATQDGGAIFGGGSNTRLTRAEITGNRAVDDGGGVAIVGGALSSRASTFADNEANGDGGALHLKKSALFLGAEDRFDGNIAGNRGGGGFADRTTRVEIEDSAFVANTAGGEGGAAFIATDRFTVSRSRFAENDPNIIDDIGLGGTYPTDSISIGGGGADRLVGADVDDSMFGFGGADTLIGLGGDDVLWGDDGNDHIRGNAGNDALFGVNGNDILEGGNANDFVIGGSGNDQLFGNSGADDLFGGPGNDTLDGGVGLDSLLGEEGDDRMLGGGGRDTLLGGAGQDTLVGGAGADILIGQDGRDTLQGGQGDDTLAGSGDVDFSIGGAGADVFVLETIGRVRIDDFVLGVDRLGLFGIEVDDLVRRGENIFAFGEVVATVDGIDTLQLQNDDFVILT